MTQTILDLTDRHILPFVFHTTKRPMLFIELLKANKMHHDGMKLEGNIPGFRLRLGRAYLLFFALWHLVILPGIALFHKPLAKLDCHLSIILAIVFTALVFVSFGLFKEWLIERMTQKVIKAAWEVHLPHFDYELHSAEVAQIYAKAVEQGIPKKEMHLYILNHLIAT